jgi:transcriptional regulator with XRE-family HTH domain
MTSRRDSERERPPGWETFPSHLTGNQLVAHNLRRARGKLSQEEVGELLESYLGVRWSKASVSDAERSLYRGHRKRSFSADEIIAFARAFDLPVWWFLLPPQSGNDPSDFESYRSFGMKDESQETALSAEELTRLVLGLPPSDGGAVVAERLAELIPEADGVGHALRAVEVRDLLRVLDGYQAALEESQAAVASLRRKLLEER